MVTVNLLVTFAVPWCIGMAILLTFWRVNKFQDLLIITGAGYFVGFATVTQAFYYFGFDNVIKLFVGALIILVLKSKNTLYVLSNIVLRKYSIGRLKLAFIIIAVCWVLLRMYYIWEEVLLQPLIAWDAWSEHLAKGKVWYYRIYGNKEAGSFPVNNIKIAGFHEFSSNFASLVALWQSIGIGRWDEAYILLPWYFTIISVLLSLLGVINYNQPNVLGSFILVCFILLCPMLNTHMALPGYLDIWIACVISIIVGISSLTENNHKAKQSGIIMVFVLLAVLPVIKYKSGLIWVINICISYLLIYMNKRLVIWLLFCAISALYIIVINEFVLSIDHADTIRVGYSGGILYLLTYAFSLGFDLAGFKLMYQYLFGSSVWNIFWCLFVLVIFLYKPSIKHDRGFMRLALLIMFCELMFFSLTNSSVKELTEHNKTTSLQRGILQLYVPVVYYVACMLSEIVYNKSIEKEYL